MKACFLIKPSNIEEKPLVTREIKLKDLAENEVLVKIEYCGICKIDLDIIEGKWMLYGYPRKLPLIPGHEIIGRVEKIGSKVSNFKLNERVAISFIYDSCDQCYHCLMNRQDLCESLIITGESADGGLAEYIKIKSKRLIKIPSWIKDETFALCEFAIAFKGLNYIKDNFESKIAIIGDDTVAKFAKTIAKMRNLDVKYFSMRKDDPSSNELKYIEIGYFDYALVTYDSHIIIEEMLHKLKKGGELILTGLSSIKVPHFFENKKIIGIGIPNQLEIVKSFELLKKINGIDVEKKYFKLEETNEVLKEIKYGNKRKFIFYNKA